MARSQSGILEPVPAHSRYVSFTLRAGVSTGALEGALRALSASATQDGAFVVGLGLTTVAALKRTVPGLRELPRFEGTLTEIPTTPRALWLWLRGDDPGELLHLDRELASVLQPAFLRDEVVDGFRFRQGHDLTGYEDGTENPPAEKAPAVALVSGAGPGLDGSSYVAVQRWTHKLDDFERLTAGERDNVMGRRLTDNEELSDAPATAHVKRSAQESFEPDAFMLRRSMPWIRGEEHGLEFVAFGKSFDAFEAVLRRMVGAEDGQIDALFRFTRPINGSYFWCPPATTHGLDLSALGL
jgi:putative iron-dependent peroxidase